MGQPFKPAGTAFFGHSDSVGVSRAIAEFRSGRPVIVEGAGGPLLALPVEGLDNARLADFVAFARPIRPRLVITERRAHTLGLPVVEPIELELAPDTDAATILTLVAEATAELDFVPEAASPCSIAAISLVKLAQVLPAVLVADTKNDRADATNPSLVTVRADAVGRFRRDASRALKIAGEAHIPLASGVRTRFVVFRDLFGVDTVAVIVGTPDMSKPVPVRMHSACLTGDIFGSRRCDCGDQLKLALHRVNEAGGGIVLYLPQEGRGLGLANKMRTYQLQDGGLDTVDANTTLGFHEDERDYGVAGRILQMLGCNRVLLLTNNPAKVEGLSRTGIEVVSRMPLEAPINSDNRRYLTAKASRAGHHLGHLLATLAPLPDDDRPVPVEPAAR